MISLKIQEIKDSVYKFNGKKDITIHDIDVINLKTGDKEIWLKRLYG